MLAMEQRECRLRVEVDDWKEALEQQLRDDDRLREQLRRQESELEHRSAQIAEQQGEITKSASARIHQCSSLSQQHRMLTHRVLLFVDRWL